MFSLQVQGLGRLNFLVLAGHLLAALALLGLLLVPDAGLAILITGVLALAYLALAWRGKDGSHLYPAALLLMTSYIIATSQVALREATLLWYLPLYLVFSGVALRLRRNDQTGLALPFELAGHLGVWVLTSLILLWAPLLRVPALALIAVLLFTALDLLLSWMNKEPWYLYPAALLLATAYLILLRFAPGGAPAGLILYFSAAAVAYALLGIWIRSSRGARLAEPIEAAACSVALLAGLIGLMDRSLVGLQALVISAFAVGVLYATSRAVGFAYLIFLFAGSIGFQFIRIEGERFSPEFVDQFLVGLIIVGIIFLYPLLRRVIAQGFSLRGWLVEGRWVRVLALGLPIAILIPAIGVNYVFEATENPTFCGSCHVMEKQFRAWDGGSHRDVTCDTCHYPPGIDLFVQGKVVGLVEVINNAAGTFGPRLHGTVDNANCETCHAREDLVGVESPYRGKIYYNHAELEPGKNSDIVMRCNNCHAHIAEGFHFQVRESTCYWCHFKGRRGQSTAVGTCFSCHEVPRNYTHIGVIPSQNEKDCTSSGCHTNVTEGQGNATEERCLACHTLVDPQAGDAKAMHDLHIVSETTFLSRKVECLECHEEIIHGEEEVPGPVISVFGP